MMLIEMANGYSQADNESGGEKTYTVHAYLKGRTQPILSKSNIIKIGRQIDDIQPLLYSYPEAISLDLSKPKITELLKRR